LAGATLIVAASAAMCRPCALARGAQQRAGLRASGAGVGLGVSVIESAALEAAPPRRIGEAVAQLARQVPHARVVAQRRSMRAASHRVWALDWVGLALMRRM
jgi:hypothetical protein